MTAGQALRPDLTMAFLIWVGLVGFAAQPGPARGRSAVVPAMTAHGLGGCSSLGVVAALVALWAEIAALKLVPALFLPTPARAWNALIAGFARGDLEAKLAGTLAHMSLGWLSASLVGVALGALIGSSRQARELVGTDAGVSAPAAGFRGHSGRRSRYSA